MLITGIASLPYRNARADCVVVGYENSAGGLTPFTVFQPTYKRERLKGRFDFKRDVNEILALTANYRVNKYLTASAVSTFGLNQSNQSVFDYQVANVGGAVAFVVKF